VAGGGRVRSTVTMTAAQLSMLLEGLDWEKPRARMAARGRWIREKRPPNRTKFLVESRAARRIAHASRPHESSERYDAAAPTRARSGIKHGAARKRDREAPSHHPAAPARPVRSPLGTARSRSAAVGSAAPVGGWSRGMSGSPRMSSRLASSSPTTRRFPCSIPVAAGPRLADCGSIRATIGPGPGQTRRRLCTSTAPIARPSGRRPISTASAASSRSTAMPASNG
jgi:hypothetical protein